MLLHNKFKNYIFLLASILLISSCEKPSLNAQEFFDYTNFSLSGSHYGFNISDDRFLVNHNESGIFNAYEFDIQSQEFIPLTTSDAKSFYGLSYFPSDNRVILQADNQGDELNHIFVKDDTEIIDLTDYQDTRAKFLGFSVDGASFYIASNQRDSRTLDIYKYSSDDYSASLVYQNDNAYEVTAKSDGDRYFVLTHSVNNYSTQIVLYDQIAGEEINVTNNKAENRFLSFMGNNILFSSNFNSDFEQLWSINLMTNEEKQVYKTAWDVVGANFYEDAGTLHVFTNDDASTKLAILSAEDFSELSNNILPAEGLKGYSLSRANDQYAYIYGSDTSPGDLFISNTSLDASLLIRPAFKNLDEGMMVSSEVIRFKSFDGLEIPSILYKPKGASASNQVPVMVYVHGGPGGQTRKGFNSQMQYMLHHGYGVLGVNNRGSSGYGKEFYHLDDKQHGEGDLQDIIASKQYLQSLSWVDVNKIGVMGGSYGGFMTLAALTFYPDVFNVGIDIFGVSNWVRTLKSIPPWWESFKVALYDEMGDPATDEARHRKISPLFHAQKITKPMLVIQGSNDPRVLQVESDEIVNQVRENNIYVDYLIFPDEGHGFRKKINRVDAADSIVDFLDKCLKQNLCS
jgi:dipeptidyl aminopeptidase/acylaminoacyl peptidase